MNSRTLVLFCLVLLAATAYSTTYTYETKYMAAVTVDGNSDGWTAQQQHLTSVPGGTESENYIMLSYKVVNPNTKTQKNMLCGFFWISDNVNNAAMDYVSLYNTVVTSEHPILKFGRNARVYDVHDNAIMNSEEYQYKKTEFAGGWQGEFCVPFSYAEFATSSETIKGAIIRYENNKVPQSVWPFGPTSSWELHSADNWLVPVEAECTSDSECKDTETCVDGSCKAVHTGACGYVANHQWNEYQCCDNSYCIAGKTCINNVCASGNVCTTDQSCADTEYCAVAATGNKCLPADGTCGYAKNHQWNPYDCCKSEDCSQNAYCSGNVCIEIQPKGCGHIVNHTWESYECCNNAGCVKGKSCIANKCIENGAIEKTSCSGKLGLNVFYYDKKNNLMAAEISGLSSCEGNVVFIRQDSCTGAAACAFNIGSNGDYCTFAIPNQPGFYKYVACVDINGDVSYGPDETAEIGITIEKECKSVGCTPKTWGSCVCEGNSTKGYKSGRCVDNCLNQNMYQTNCSCGAEVIIPTEEIKPPGEQVPAKTPAVEVPPAPNVPIEYWQIAAVICIIAIPVLLHLLTKEKK